MTHRHLLIVGLVIAGGFVASASSGRSPAYQPDPSLTFLRTVNSLQAAGHANGYRALSELLADPAFESFRPQLVVSGADVELGASRVTLVLSADRRAYHMSIVATTGCQTSWFTSDAGVIYRGTPIGCQ